MCLPLKKLIAKSNFFQFPTSYIKSKNNGSHIFQFINYYCIDMNCTKEHFQSMKSGRDNKHIAKYRELFGHY